jgi:hypothetical protein
VADGLRDAPLVAGLWNRVALFPPRLDALAVLSIRRQRRARSALRNIDAARRYPLRSGLGSAGFHATLHHKYSRTARRDAWECGTLKRQVLTNLPNIVRLGRSYPMGHRVATRCTIPPRLQPMRRYH